MNVSSCERILIVKPSSLGDVVHTLPAAEAIHRSAPNAKIDWVVNSEWAQLLEGISFLNRLVTFPRREFSGLAGLLKAKRWADDSLGNRPYDLAIDFQGLLRSAWLARKSGAPRIAGFQQARESAPMMYTDRVDVSSWNRTHAVDRNLKLAEAVGADISAPGFSLPSGEPILGLEEKNTGGVLLHPFSRGAGKSLSTEEVKEFCTHLAPVPVLLVGMPDRPLDIAWPNNVIDLLGQTNLSQLIYLIRRSAWIVSIDSGPMHLAAALTSRVLSLHTWSNPSMVGPWQPEAWIYRDTELVQTRDLDPDRFPERRDWKRLYEKKDRLYSPTEIETMADFVSSQLAA